MCGCLSSLAQDLTAIGGWLTIRRGSAVQELATLANEIGAQAIFFNRDPDPFGRQIEGELFAFGEKTGIEIVGFCDATVHEPGEVLNSSGEPFRVFTAYARAWVKAGKVKAQGRVPTFKVPEGIASLTLPTLATWGLQPEADVLEAGEKAARSRMKRFIEHGLASYGRLRNSLAGEFTSRLSQDLRFGLLSIRELLERCQERAALSSAGARKSAEKFISELIWREFYFSILWHYPEVLDTEFNPKFRGMKWPGTRVHFDRWRAGETGFPDRRRGHAATCSNGLYAQSGADDCRDVSNQGPPRRLEAGRKLFHAETNRRRNRQQQRWVAMERRDWCRRRALFPNSESLDTKRALRSGGRICKTMGARAEEYCCRNACTSRRRRASASRPIIPLLWWTTRELVRRRSSSSRRTRGIRAPRVRFRRPRRTCLLHPQIDHGNCLRCLQSFGGSIKIAPARRRA